MAYERQKWTSVQPRKTDLRDGPGPSANDYAGIASQGHEHVACVTHATRHNHRCWPIWRRHVVWRHDAQYQTARSDSTLSSNFCCGAAATADQGHTERSQERARFAGALICRGAWFGTTENAHLRPASRLCRHGRECRLLMIAADTRRAERPLLADGGLTCPVLRRGGNPHLQGATKLAPRSSVLEYATVRKNQR